MHFVVLFYGLTQDCISSTLFGVYGLTFFSYSFFGQWLEKKIWQKTTGSVLLFGFLGLISIDFLASLLASTTEGRWLFSHYLTWQVWLQILLASALILPCYAVFRRIPQLLTKDPLR